MKKLALGLLMAAGMALPGMALAHTVTIGFTTSATGKFHTESMPQLLGFEMWRDQVNANGGIDVDGTHYKIKLKHYNDQSKAGRVQQLYKRLIVQDGVDFLFSPYSSGLTETAAAVSEQYGKNMLTIGAAEGKTYTLGNHHLFQMYTPASQYLASSLRLVRRRDPHARVALVYANSPFPKGAAEGAVKMAGKLGLEIVFKQAYAPGTTNFGPIIGKIAASGADVLVGGGYYADGSALTRQLYAAKVRLKSITLLIAPSIPKFATLGKAAVGVQVPTQWTPQASYKPDFGPTPREFTEAFEKRYGYAPGYHAAGSYATGLVLQHAIEKAGSIKTEAVTRALNHTDVMTFYGHIKFGTDKDNHGLQIGHKILLAQWQKDSNGKLVKQLVYPKSVRTSAMLYPLHRF